MDHSAIRADDKATTGKFDKILHRGFDELLSFIERHFTKYFDHDAKAPGAYLSLARKDSLANMNEFRLSLASMNADLALIDLVLRVLKKIAGNLLSKFYMGTGTKESLRSMLLSMIYYIEKNQQDC